MTAVLSGCTPAANTNFGAEPTTLSYTEPKASRLKAIRPYPSPDDVCQVIGENAFTAEFIDDAYLLIGCPKHEKGAIADRKLEGAKVVAHAKHWTLLNIRIR